MFLREVRLLYSIIRSINLNYHICINVCIYVSMCLTMYQCVYLYINVCIYVSTPTGIEINSKLNFIDLAGSEMVGKTDATGEIDK